MDIRLIIKMLNNDDVCIYGDDYIFIAKGKYELVHTWKEKWKKIKFISMMNISRKRLKKEKERVDRKIEVLKKRYENN